MTSDQDRRRYRNALSFSSQSAARTFLSAKDIQAQIDYSYAEELAERVCFIAQKINESMDISCRLDDFIIASICSNIKSVFDQLKSNDLISRLNNHGRRPEDVVFSWLRGYAISELFIPHLAHIFNVDLSTISIIGDDDYTSVDTFRRTPRADFNMVYLGQNIRIEMQSGFQGLNDIKEHKIDEAISVFKKSGEHTICVHFDIFNGQVAFIQLNKIIKSNFQFSKRQQFESQQVLNLDDHPKYFKWFLLDPLPTLESLELDFT